MENQAVPSSDERPSKWDKVQSRIVTGAMAFVAGALGVSVLWLAFFDQASRSDVSSNDSVGWLFTFVAVLISGVYVFTTFRIDRGTKAEARETARKVTEAEVPRLTKRQAKGYLKRHAKALKRDARATMEKAEKVVCDSLDNLQKDVTSEVEAAKAKANAKVVSLGDHLAAEKKRATEDVGKAICGAKSEAKDVVNDFRRATSDSIAGAKAEAGAKLGNVANEVRDSLGDKLFDHLKPAVQDAALEAYKSLSLRQRLFPSRIATTNAKRAGR